MSAVSKPTAAWARTCYGVDDASGCVVRAERNGRRVNYEVMSPSLSVTAKSTEEGAAVAAAMPVGVGIAAWVAAPFASISKAQKVFPTLLDIQLPFPLEDCLSSFSEPIRLSPGDTMPMLPRAIPGEQKEEPAGRTNPCVASLAVAARTTDVERRLAELDGMGVDPHALDYEGVALWTQALREQDVVSAADTAMNVVMFLRSAGAVMVIGRGEHFCSAHRIRIEDPSSLDRFLRAQSRQPHSDAEATTLPVNWFWGGTGLAVGEKGAMLRSEVEERWPGSSTTLDTPDSFLARALATRALLPGPSRTNLRSGPLAHMGAQSRTEQARIRTAGLLLLAGMLLCGSAAWWESSMASHLGRFERAFRSRLDRLVGYPVRAKGANALLIADRELAERSERLAPLAAALESTVVTDLQHVLVTIGRHDVRIERLDASSGTFSIRGSVSSVAHAQTLRDSLAASGYQGDLTLGDEADGVTRFVLDVVRESPDE